MSATEAAGSLCGDFSQREFDLCSSKGTENKGSENDVLGRWPLLRQKSNRESVMFFYGSDLLSLKWRNFKVHFNMRELPRGPAVVAGQGVTHSLKIEPGYPWIFDLANDPKELWDINSSNGWLAATIGKITGEYAQSVAKFPNIKPGADGPEEKR